MLKDEFKKILEQQKNPKEKIVSSLNKEELLQYAIEHNINDIDILLKAIEQQEENLNNEEMKMDEDLKNQIKTLCTEIKADIRVLKNDISNTRWMLTILITIFGIFTPLLFMLHSNKIDAKFETLDTKYESIIQEIRDNRELNQIQIERDVIKEVSKQIKQ